MHFSIFGGDSNKSLYTMGQLRREARSVAKGKGRLVDHYIELRGERAVLCVHVRRKDGIGEILRTVL